ncbi:hypothetical protein COB52_05775 [Candidatus Kaiserbacteria bacterium]|nr:MAG: hypothetical protein COB52_05775 [Candidatus Kaiserbacteria bacterium]
MAFYKDSSDNKESAFDIMKKKSFSRQEVQIEDIALGENFSMALDRSGTVYTWGANEFG